jgi:hypothetical protein
MRDLPAGSDDSLVEQARAFMLQADWTGGWRPDRRLYANDGAWTSRRVPFLRRAVRGCTLDRGVRESGQAHEIDWRLQPP